MITNVLEIIHHSTIKIQSDLHLLQSKRYGFSESIIKELLDDIDECNGRIQDINHGLIDGSYTKESKIWYNRDYDNG